MADRGNGNLKLSAETVKKQMEERKKEKQCGTAAAAPQTAGIDDFTLHHRDPVGWARKYVEVNHMSHGLPTLWSHDGVLWKWTGSSYIEINPDEMFSNVQKFLDKCQKVNSKGDRQPFRPRPSEVNDTISSIRCDFQIHEQEGSFWIGEPKRDASGMIACLDTLLDLRSRATQAQTPAFFTPTALPMRYNAEATCPNWLEFLQQTWPNDQQSIDTLQEIFGCILGGETKYQKIFLIVGPPRGGKGVISRILTKLAGPRNVASPTLSGMCENFGMSSLINKSLSVIADARFSGGKDQAKTVERLLTISGEDTIDVDRKHKPIWVGKLSTRFLILTNEIPNLRDASGALANRFITLQLTKSHLGAEDLDLEKRLAKELAGILNWSLDGYDRLTERGHFLEPEASAFARELLSSSGSPMKDFLEEKCELGDGLSVDCTTLYSNWKVWCEGTDGKSGAGVPPGDKHRFGRMLHAAAPQVERKRYKRDGVNGYEYRGVGLA